MVPPGTVTAALRVPLARRRSGCAKGFQLLKSPTTDTAPSGSSAGRAKVTRTVPSRPGLVVLINCSLHSGAQLRYTRSIMREPRARLWDLTKWQPGVSHQSAISPAQPGHGRGNDRGGRVHGAVLAVAPHAGQVRERAVADQAARPVAAGHRRSPGEQATGRAVIAGVLAVEGQCGQVQGPVAQAELVPVDDAGDALAVRQNVGQVQVVVRVV